MENYLEPLAKGVYLFRQHHDREFIEWCHGNPDMFVWNACEPNKHKLDNVDGTLHWALPKGMLCQTFRNRPNLSTTYRKVVSKDLDDLKKWAEEIGSRMSSCYFCRRTGRQRL